MVLKQLSIRFGLGGHEGEYVVHLPQYTNPLEVQIPHNATDHLRELLPGWTVLNRGSRIEIFQYTLADGWGRDDDLIVTTVTQWFEKSKDDLDRWAQEGW